MVIASTRPAYDADAISTQSENGLVPKPWTSGGHEIQGGICKFTTVPECKVSTVLVIITLKASSIVVIITLGVSTLHRTVMGKGDLMTGAQIHCC